MALSEFDRNLLQRCLAREPRSWENFVDRFLGLVLHVVNHTARSRSTRLSDQDREDLVADVFLAIVRDDFGVLKQFRGKSSLATYLTVVARRVVVRQLMKRSSVATLDPVTDEVAEQPGFEDRIGDREEVERLLSGLADSEANVVRMYHLEGKTYSEISSHTGMPENSVGPMLSRARARCAIAPAKQASSRRTEAGFVPQDFSDLNAVIPVADMNTVLRLADLYDRVEFDTTAREQT